MEQAELKLLRSTDSFRRDLKTFLFHSVGSRIRIDSVMCPRSSSRGRNTSSSVTVTVTEELVLRPLLEDRGHITESIRILEPTE